MKENRLKACLSLFFATLFRACRTPAKFFTRLIAHASLASQIMHPLDSSVIVLGAVDVLGTGDVSFGKNLLLYRDLCFETQESGKIYIADDVVISRGVQIVSHERIEIGAGSMIGEYTSIRDANHRHGEGLNIRSSGYKKAPIQIGENVWIGRGVCILPGITIGNNAVVGANAVVTHNVAPFSTVAGVPARLLKSKKEKGE